MRSLACLALCVFVGVVSGAEFLGPSPYFAFDGATPSDLSGDPGQAISPFAGLAAVYFYLEDFEDSAFDSPGVRLLEFANEDIEFVYSDSVDGDDGVIDGFGNRGAGGGRGKSLFSARQSSTFTFVFSADVLGTFPTHAGLVWTDVGRDNGGTPRAEDHAVTFEAFDRLGASLGTIGPVELGDDFISSETAEDRFLGVIHQEGISSIRVVSATDNWEVDHLQYGSVVPEPTGAVLTFTALLGFVVVRRRRPTGSLRSARCAARGTRDNGSGLSSWEN